MVDYLVTESELTQLANTIRAHCGGFMPLMYPFEYITKIKNTKLGNYGDYGDL